MLQVRTAIMATLRPLLAGNWKMNGTRASLSVISALRDAVAAGRMRGTDVVVPPVDVVKVAESGVSGTEDAARYAAEGADVVLVGEALVKDGDPRAAVAAMKSAAASCGARSTR